MYYIFGWHLRVTVVNRKLKQLKKTQVKNKNKKSQWWSNRCFQHHIYMSYASDPIKHSCQNIGISEPILKQVNGTKKISCARNALTGRRIDRGLYTLATRVLFTHRCKKDTNPSREPLRPPQRPFFAGRRSLPIKPINRASLCWNPSFMHDNTFSLVFIK